MSAKELWTRFAAWVNGEAAPAARFEKEYQPKHSPLFRRKPREVSTGQPKTYEVWFYRVSAVLASVALIGILLATVTRLPLHGTPGTPDQNEVAERYVSFLKEITGSYETV